MYDDLQLSDTTTALPAATLLHRWKKMILSTGTTLNHAPFHVKLKALVGVHFQPSTYRYSEIIVHKMWRKVIVTTVFCMGALPP